MKKYIILFLLIPFVIFSQSPDLTLIQVNFVPTSDTTVTPPDTGEVACTDSIGGWVYPSYYSSGESNTYLSIAKFNAFHVVDSCKIGCFAIWIPDYTGDRTDDSVRFFLYTDTIRGGEHYPGSPIACAWEYHYNWTIVGKDANHFFAVDSLYNGATGHLSPDDTLWIGVWSEPQRTLELWTIRGGAAFPGCATGKASDSDGTNWPFTYNPVSTDFDILYGGEWPDPALIGSWESCVGNSIWGELIP